MRSAFNGLVALVLVLGLVAALGAAGAWVFHMLWAWLAVGVFGAPTLSFWQAWGALILVGFIGRRFAPAPAKAAA